MTEPKYNEDVVNLGYLKRALGLTDEQAAEIYKYISKHYGSKPQPPYYRGDTWIDGNIIYTCIQDRLVGTYQDSDWVTESGAKREAERKSKVFLRQPSDYNIGDMWILQSDTDHRAGKRGEILISTAGRRVYDADDWVNMLGYGTIRSINEVANNINDALIRLELNKESGVLTIYYADAVPSSAIEDDLWYVTEDVSTYEKDKLYKYDGIDWELIEDELIIVAFEEANQARLVEDGKIQSFYSTEEPTTGLGAGDIWTDTSNNKLYRYNGTNWVAVYDTRISEIRINLDTVTEKTTTLETDLGSITGRVTEVETTTQTITNDLGEAQSDIISLAERTGTLEIDSSSIKSRVSSTESNIINLQAQIDGAIQFWNGSDIPTVNNYPASDWTTEALKNNHRADIYTVIEDVNGELKQGKSYRFDKVGNTWQWIELTDNELSAVQALANSKAKVFLTTPIVPYNLGDLWLNNGKLYRCKTVKDSSGSYASSDWEEAVEYTDDTIANLAQLAAEAAQGTANSAVAGVNSIRDTDGEAEGKYIYLSNSNTSPLISAKFGGETSQDTRSGKNLFNASLIPSSTNIVVSNYGKTITMPEMSSGNGYVNTGKTLAQLCPKLQAGDIVYLYGTTTSEYQNLIYLSGSNISWRFNATIPRTITQADLDSTVALYGNKYNSGETGQIVITELRIVTTQNDTWEQYGVMPSPDYPSRIKNIEGRNLINNDILLYDYSNVTDSYNTVTKIETGIRYSTTFSTGTPIIVYNTGIDLTEYTGKTIRMKSKFANGGRIRIYFTNADASARTQKAETTVSESEIICEVPEDLAGRNYLSYSLGITVATASTIDFENLILTIDDSNTSYAPYNSLAIKSIGKNILNKNRNALGSNVTKTILDTGIRVTTKVAGSARYCGIELGRSELLGKKITISSTITSSSTNNGALRLFFGKYNTPSTSGIATALVSTGSLTVTVPNEFYPNTDRVYLLLYSNVNSTQDVGLYVDYTNLQVEIGEEATSYEKYKEQIAYFPLEEGQKLYEGSYLADDGIHNKMTEVKLAIADMNNAEDYPGWTNVPSLYSYYPNKNGGFNTFNIKYKSNLRIQPLSGTDYIKLNTNSSNNKIYFAKTMNENLTETEWKTNYPDLIFQFQYELPEEEIVAYTSKQQEAWNKIMELTTYKNVTNIYSDAYAHIEYVKNNGLDIYETKANASRKYTETVEKFAQQQITNDSITNTVSQTITTVNNNYNELKTKFDDYAPASDVVSLQTSVEQIQTNTYTKTEVNEKLIDGSVQKVSTTAGTFDSNGLTIEKTNAKTKGNFNETGITVLDATSGEPQELLFAGYDETLNETIVRTNNITVEKYLTLKNVARQERYVNPVLGGKAIGTFML